MSRHEYDQTFSPIISSVRERLIRWTAVFVIVVLMVSETFPDVNDFEVFFHYANLDLTPQVSKVKSASEGSNGCFDNLNATLPNIMYAFFLPFGNEPVPVGVTGLRYGGELARAAVFALQLPFKLKRAITSADVNLFVISHKEAMSLMNSTYSSLNLEKRIVIKALDFLRPQSLCYGNCLLLELKQNPMQFVNIDNATTSKPLYVPTSSPIHQQEILLSSTSSPNSSSSTCLYSFPGHLLNEGPPRTYAVFSTDTVDVQYFAISPLSAYIWRHAHGVTPIVFLSISQGQTLSTLTQAQRLLARYLISAGAVVWLLEHDSRDREASTLQIVRLAAWALPFVRPDDLIITCDADIWPLAKSFWNSVVNPTNRSKLFIFDANFYEGQIKRGSCDNVAISEMAMERAAWNEMYQLWVTAERNLPAGRACQVVNSDSFFMSVVASLMQAARKGYTEAVWAANRETREKHNRIWSADQFLSSEMVKESHWCPERCTLNKYTHRLHSGTEYLAQRIIDSWTDGHMPVLSDPSVLASLLPIWNDLLGPGHEAFPLEFHAHAMDLKHGLLSEKFGVEFFQSPNLFSCLKGKKA